MKRDRTNLRWALLLAGGLVLLPWPGRCEAGIYVIQPLGRLVREADDIVLAEVESVDRERNVITYRKLEDLKGKHPDERIRHFGPKDFDQPTRRTAVGKKAVLFFIRAQLFCGVCLDDYWYLAGKTSGEWRTFPWSGLMYTFCGQPRELAAAVKDVLAGKEVILPCVVSATPRRDVDLEEVAALSKGGPYKLGRVRASLKLQDFDPKRDLVEEK
jgi:hypothetical protein